MIAGFTSKRGFSYTAEDTGATWHTEKKIGEKILQVKSTVYHFIALSSGLNELLHVKHLQ